MISFLIILLYIIYIIINYGVPKSISATYYLIKPKWIFSLVLIFSMVLSFNQFMDITPDSLKFLPFIFCSGIIFVAAAPNFKTSTITDKVHDYAAIISFVVSLIWAALIDPVPLLMWIFVFFYIINKFNEYKSLSLMIQETCIKFWTELIMLFIIFSEIIGY